MRVLVMFDLPTESLEDKKVYRHFRKFLLSEGFLMFQFSIYSKLVLNHSSATLVINRLRENHPKKGIVTVLTITEKQFSKMIYLSGSRNMQIANSDNRIVFLGDVYDD